MILLSIALVSAAILAYEVLLIRVFTIVQWHHFAYMVISIALLGFGASGTFLALARRRLHRHFTAAFTANATLFGLTALLGYDLGQRVPFNALEIVWDARQLLHLLALYLVFTVPFFCGANCIGLAFICFGDKIGRIYCYNLVGSGVGALGIVAALFVLSPPECLRVIAALGLTSAALACVEARRARNIATAVGLLVAAMTIAFALPKSWPDLRLSPYKGLSQALERPGAEVIAARSNPLGYLSVVASPTIPFRHAPGLSLNNTVVPPAQLGVFTDGDGLSVITAFDGRRGPLAYLDFTTAAVPYHLIQAPSVLILGAGGGADVLQAVFHHASRIDAVELNPDLVHLVRHQYGDFAGDLYRRPEVEVHVAEARAFVARSKQRWDLIQIPLLESVGTSAAAVQSLSESYVYTVEAFRAYLRHLEPDGLLAITRWVKLPPRDSLKLFATALEALRRENVPTPASQLAIIRGWSTSTLLVRNGTFSIAEKQRIRAFAGERSFDVDYLDDLAPEEANRYNQMAEAYVFDGASALSRPGALDYMARYKFNIAPATDDRPYFFDFFKWRSLSEFLRLPAQGAALLEWGYLILWATLIQAVVLSGVLILLPLWLRRHDSAYPVNRGRILFFFTALGLGFLFIEIAFIQRFILFLGDPLYAAAVVIAGFLIFAGLGSGIAPTVASKLQRSPTGPKPVVRVSAIDLAVVAIIAIAGLYLVGLAPLLERLMILPELARVGLSLVLIAPLAFFMGFPFPLALARVSRHVPALVPWAWGVNGCASVVSAVLAQMLAMHFGFTFVVSIAGLFYLLAAAIFRGALGPKPAAAA